MQELLMEALHDTLRMLPFLYVTYLFMEYLEHKNSARMESILAHSRTLGPLLGAAFGIVPQCGFSVIASGLYINQSITLGTLIAVFVSTSDEAIPILISQPDQLSTLTTIIILKIIIAVVAGYAVDALVRSHHLKSNHALHDTHAQCDAELEKHSSIWYIAFIHTIKIFSFIFVVNLGLSIVIAWVGEDALSTLLVAGSFMQPVLTAVLGFLPNCAASILLAQLYVDGVLSFGALSAGLITSAGLGFLVLFKMYDNKRDILRIMGILLTIACLSGIVLQVILG